MKNSLIIIAAFLLTACISQQNFRPQSFQVIGDYTHESSGVTFPQVVNSFRRVNIIKFNEDETNIGVGYNDPIHQIALTLYVYPPQEPKSIGSPKEVIDEVQKQLFANTYQSNKNEILNSHENTKLLIEEGYHLAKYEPHLGAHAVFEYTENFAGKDQTVVSHLYLMQVGSQIFKYRVTYPNNRNRKKYVDQFVENFELR